MELPNDSLDEVDDSIMMEVRMEGLTCNSQPPSVEPQFSMPNSVRSVHSVLFPKRWSRDDMIFFFFLFLLVVCAMSDAAGWMWLDVVGLDWMVNAGGTQRLMLFPMTIGRRRLSRLKPEPW